MTSRGELRALGLYDDADQDEWAERGLCRLQTRGGFPIDDPCPVCGHMNFLHPGPGNPALTECVFCRLLNSGGPR